MRLYEVRFGDNTIMNFWADNMSHAEEQALNARPEETPENTITDIHRYDDLESGALSFCDICDLMYRTYSNEDHCIECGNCFDDCIDKKTHPRP